MITVVGIGALGSHVVQFLRNIPECLRVIDFDRVERKNVKSQFHGKSSVGKGKVQSLQKGLQFYFGTKVEGVPHKLTSDNVEQLLGEATLVLDCLDNGEARRLVQGYVRKHGIPCLHGALAANGALGLVAWDEVFEIDDGASGAATCEEGDFLPLIALTSAFMAQSVSVFLESGKKLSFQVIPRGVPVLL